MDKPEPYSAETEASHYKRKWQDVMEAHRFTMNKLTDALDACEAALNWWAGSDTTDWSKRMAEHCRHETGLTLWSDLCLEQRDEAMGKLRAVLRANGREVGS